MPGADIRRFSSDRRGMVLNAPVAIIAASLLAFADAFLFPAIVLPVVSGQLTSNLTAVGLVVSLAGGLWHLPQVLGTGVIQHRTRVKPVVLFSGAVRAGALGLFAYIGFRADRFTDAELLRWLIFALIVSTLTGAFAVPPLNALSLRSIRPEQRRQLLVMRSILALVLAVAAGAIMGQIFALDGPGFPRSLTLVVLAAAASVSAGTFLAGLIREPRRVYPITMPSLAEGIRGAVSQLRHASIRRFLLFRSFTAVTAGFDPLIILYGIERLAIPPQYIGYFVAAYAVARLASDPLWTFLSRQAGHRAVLQTSIAVRLLALGAALAVPAAAESDIWRDNITRANAPSLAFGLSFVFLGIATAGLSRGSFGYLSDIVPQPSRFFASSLINTILMVLAFAPLVIFAVAKERGLEDAVTAGAVIAMISLLVSGILVDSASSIRRRSAISATRIRRANPTR